MNDGQRQLRSAAGIDRAGSVARLSIHNGGGLNEPRLQQIVTAFDQLAEDRTVEAIYLSGEGGVFLSGADLPFFIRCVASNQIDRIVRFTQSAHEFLSRIESCPKPVVAWIQGAAFGAGLELALACHTIVASTTAKFSMPETSLGIYPGMGGTQRLPRRIGSGLAKWMIYTGAIVPSAQALEIGLVDAVQPAQVSVDELLATSRREHRRPDPESRFATLQRFFDEHILAELLDPGFGQPSAPELVRALIQIRNNGPIALRMAERLIDQGQTMRLEEAIQHELSGLRQVFATDDAMTGLLTFGKNRASS